MLLKGIIMIVIGLAGIIGTIMWFVKSIRKADRSNGALSYKGKKVITYTKERPDRDIDEQITFNNSNSSKFNFSNEEAESTVLLNEFGQERGIEETVLLEDDD